MTAVLDRSATATDPAVAPPGFWEREASHYPRPMSPLCASIMLPSINKALRRVFSDFSLLVDTLEQREIGGWIYSRLVPLGGKDQAPPPAWLMPLLVRAVPSLRRRIQRCVAVQRADLQGQLIDRWYAEWQQQLVERIARLRDADLPSLGDTDLLEHFERTVALMEDGDEIHFLLHGGLCMILGELAFACRDLLGWGDRKTFALLNGLSAKSTEPSRRLAELARMAADRPAIRALLVAPNEHTAARLPEADREFAEAFTAYMNEYGCRALRYELSEPAMSETPSLVLGLLRDQLTRGYDPAADGAALAAERAAIVGEARTALAGRPEADRRRFERALERAAHAYPVREDNEFYTVSAPMALTRFALLELGAHMKERGQIAERDDIFFLHLPELRSGFRSGADLRGRVDQRKSEREQVLANPGPASYGINPGPPPSLAAFPPEVRFAMEALAWVLERIFGAPRADAPAEQAAGVRGIAAAPGRYTGPVRVIMGEDEFDKLEPGDVLVCPITSPVWSVLFPSVGALVTDTGGVLSHPAIIAREYRVPAVVATATATSTLRDGQIVTVDGERGTVEIG